MGARTDQRCSICSANPDVLAAVNQALQNKQKLDDLARESGFSRAALSRHSRKHMLRHALARNREIRLLNMDGRRVVAQWPGSKEGFFTLTTIETDSNGRSHLRHLAAEEMKESDVLQVVSYDPPVAPRPILPPVPEGNPDTPVT
jgi:hypothetical protein